MPVYAVIAGLIVFRFDKVIRAWPAWLMMFAFVALCFVSKYWSIDPEVTERLGIESMSQIADLPVELDEGGGQGRGGGGGHAPIVSHLFCAERSDG